MVLFDLDLDGVEQVGLAKPRRPVDEQRVVRAGRVGRHGLGRRKGELVGRAADEVFEGEVIPAGGQGFLGDAAGGGLFPFALLGRRDGQHHLHVKAQHGLERLFQQAGVSVGYDLADEVVAHQQGHAVGVFETHGFQAADVTLVGGLGGVFPAIGFGCLQHVVK